MKTYKMIDYIVIQNVISTAHLKQRVDAQRFNEYPWGIYDVEYYKGRCGYVKDERIQGRVTVFLSGKMISTGAKSIAKSIEQLEHTKELLIKNRFINRIDLEPKIQNIVATLDLKSRIDLNIAASALQKSIFEPEQFPGLIHKIAQGATCLVFASGKIVILGANSEAALLDAADVISKELQQFQLV